MTSATRAATSASSRRRSRTLWRRPWPGSESPGRRIRATPTAPRRLHLPEPKELLAGRLRRQAGWCAELGSPLYASLLRSAADDLLAGGPVWDVLEGFEDEAGTAAVALRVMGRVHRLV